MFAKQGRRTKTVLAILVFLIFMSGSCAARTPGKRIRKVISGNKVINNPTGQEQDKSKLMNRVTVKNPIFPKQ